MQCCHVCGRPADDVSLRVGKRILCCVCERITTKIRPEYPLYLVWVQMMRGFAEVGST